MLKEQFANKILTRERGRERERERERERRIEMADIRGLTAVTKFDLIIGSRKLFVK